MANQDSATNSIPVTLSFTEQGPECVSPAFWEALRNANLRISLPVAFTSGTGADGFTLRTSTLADNITRIDNQGAIYTPGIVKVELTEQTVTMTTTTAPGVPVTMTFATPGVPDLENAIRNIEFDIQPPQSPIYIGPPQIVNGNLNFDIYRIGAAADPPPYLEVVIKGRGRLFVIPSPNPA